MKEAKEKHKPLGVELSAGGRNAYSFNCKPLDRPSTYAICLNIHRSIEEKRIGSQFLDCQEKVADGTCPALAMRAKELKHGIALYYEEYGERLKDIITESSVKKVERPTMKFETVKVSQSPVTEKPKPAPAKKEAGEDIVQFDAAAIVNEIAKEEPIKAVPQPKPKTVEKPKPEAGESPLAFARRMAQFKKENANATM